MTKAIVKIVGILLCSVAAIAADSNRWAHLTENLKPVSMEDYVASYPLYIEAGALTEDDQLLINAPGCPANSIKDIESLPKDVQKKCVEKGGLGGHAVAFLRGACIQTGTPTPQIYNCSQNPAVMADPYSGVGISTNQDFWNVAWVAIPGYKLFYAGDVGPDEELTNNRFQQVIQKIDGLHLYDTIEINPVYFANPRRPEGMNEHNFLLLDSAGSDFGSTFRGNVYTVRVPITNAQLDSVISYLNTVNLDLYNRRAAEKFDWDVVLDNCAHTVNNIFAAAGFMREKHTTNLGDSDGFPRSGPITEAIEVLKTIFSGNAAIPANTIIDIAQKTSKPELKSLAQAFRNKKLRAKIKAREALVGPGVIVGANLMHESNDMFFFGGDALIVSLPDFFPSPVFNDKRRRDKLYSSARTTVLSANQEYYISMIEKLLKKAKSQISYLSDDTYYNNKIKEFYINDFQPYLQEELTRLKGTH